MLQEKRGIFLGLVFGHDNILFFRTKLQSGNGVRKKGHKFSGSVASRRKNLKGSVIAEVIHSFSNECFFLS